MTSKSAKKKRKIVEKAQLQMEALEERQNLERRLENEEAEFKKRELEVEEKRKRSKAELTGKLEINSSRKGIKRSCARVGDRGGRVAKWMLG